MAVYVARCPPATECETEYKKEDWIKWDEIEYIYIYKILNMYI